MSKYKSIKTEVVKKMIHSANIDFQAYTIIIAYTTLLK